jgi:rhodanese-related sulfurtransferase
MERSKNNTVYNLRNNKYEGHMKTIFLAFTLVTMQLVTSLAQADENGMIIDVSTAKSFLDSGVLFVDVRSAGSYRGAHIPGAISIDVDDRDFDSKLIEHVKKDQEVVIYCSGTGCRRSPTAISKAKLLGFEKLYYFEEGFVGWINARYPTEK